MAPEDPTLLDALSEAVEAGAGLPAVARAAARLLDASVALIDRSSSVLAVAGASPDQEEAARRRRGGDRGRAARRRHHGRGAALPRQDPARADDRPHGDDAAGAGAGALARAGVGERGGRRAPSSTTSSARRVTDRGDIVARGAELGADLDRGAGVLVLRAAPRAAQTGEWRGRVLTLALRALRSLAPGPLATTADADPAAEVAVIVPAEDDERLARAAAGLARELADSLSGFHLTIGRSRRSADPVDLYRAGSEARLAVNVGEAEGRPLLAFEDTGAYRLLLPAMSDDPAELERFYAETIKPLSDYDEQYETELVDHGRGLPRQRRQRRRHRQTALHPPPHDPLPPRARPRALRPRRLLDRGPREARPRPESDASPRHRLPARPGPGAGRGRGQGGAAAGTTGGKGRGRLGHGPGWLWPCPRRPGMKRVEECDAVRETCGRRHELHTSAQVPHVRAPSV